MNKKIVNIVFYQFFDKDDKNKKACIFYNDGTVADVSFDEGIDACEIIVKERNITSKDAFREMINRDIVHVVSGKDFERNFQSYFPHKNEDENMNREVNNLIPIETLNKENNKENNQEATTTQNNTVVVPPVVPTRNEENTKTTSNDDLDEVSLNDNAEIEPTDDIDVEDVTDEDLVDTSEAEEVEDNTNTVAEPTRTTTPTNHTVVVPVPVPTNTETNNRNNATDSNDDLDEVSLNNNAEIEPTEEHNEDVADIDEEVEDLDEEIEEPTERKGFWSRVKGKVAAVVAGVLAFAAGTGVGMWIHSLLDKKAQNNDNKDNLSSINTNVESVESEAASIVVEDKDNTTTSALKTGNNQDYYGYTFEQLLEVTDSEVQKETMQNLDLAMSKFNGEFADAWQEEGKNVRPALTFDEILSLQVAYNDYSRYELHAIFNGSGLKKETEVNAEKLSRAYKDATLQLMGAHVLESSEHPVDMSMLIRSEEGKEFYKRYHEAFLAAKEATGQDQINKVTAFYNMVRSDFEVNPDKRMTGISHAEVYDIESYKLSVTPMIAAAEIMFQNLQVDVTLSDLEVEFFNNLGLCNLADGAFRRAETIALSCCETDMTNPLYEQYRNAIIKKYKDLGIYYIDDAHRELTLLDRFQEQIDNREIRCGGWIYNTWVTETTETHTEVSTRTETETKYHWEETRTEKPIPDDVKAQIDAEIEEENRRAKEEAEREAEETRRRMQEEEDENARRIEEEVRQDEEELQQAIDDANRRIDENNQDEDPTNNIPVNESDFGDAQVDFDDEHSDEQGNLDPSVENITTDPTGDQTDEPLPDPNKTGAEFDAQAPEYNGGGSENQEVYEYEEPQEEHHEEEHHEEEHHEEYHEEQHVEEYEVPAEEHYDYSDDSWVESVPVSDDTYYEDAWVEEDSSPAKETYTYEELVDAYVEQLAANSDKEYTYGYQYKKQI